MGSFEKLGILVIVVIIVMILAVAIYQWGGTDPQVAAASGFGGGAEMRIVPPGDQAQPATKRAREKNYLDEATGEDPASAERARPTRNTWAGGIPKFHKVRSGDVVWKLVVKTWRLKESFSDAITRANPDLDMARLRPGDVLRIPNPDAYRVAPRRTQPKRAADRRNLRIYEVQEGDSLGSIAQQHLGRASRYGEIVELNPGIKPRNLAPGQKIYLPRR